VRLVLLHALPLDGGMWDAEQDLLPGHTLAPTLYRLGASLTDCAEGVLSLAGDEPLVVVGCSVGGSCALEVARAAPDQVEAIVLVGAKAGVRPDPALRDEAVRLLTESGLEAAWEAYWRPLFGPATAAETIARARRMALAQDVDDVVRGVRAFHDRRDLTAFAEAWPKPLVVISGDHDRAPLPATAAAVATGPNRRFHLVSNCGHYVNLERPAEFRALLAGAVPWPSDHGCV
jgi:pimeloyl-ACP methyl ester carboxylesterase